jgi:hypothetical protein
MNQFPPSSPRVSLIVFLRPYIQCTDDRRETTVEVTRHGVALMYLCSIQSAKIHAHFHNVSIFVKG